MRRKDTAYFAHSRMAVGVDRIDCAYQDIEYCARLYCQEKLISIHSVLNKITGFALFLLPLSLAFIEPTYSILAICVLATVAVAQEIYLVAKGRDVV